MEQQMHGTAGNGNDNSSGVLYVSFVGGHPSNPILRVQLLSEEECGSNSGLHLPYSGPNEALEAAELAETSLKQVTNPFLREAP